MFFVFSDPQDEQVNVSVGCGLRLDRTGNVFCAAILYSVDDGVLFSV